MIFVKRLVWANWDIALACLFDLAIMVRWFCASELTEGIDAESKDGGIFFS